MMISRIQINPNLRVDGGNTVADLDEDVHGATPAAGDPVVVFEPMSGLVGRGWVVEVDHDERHVTVSVDWASLKVTSNNTAIVGAFVREPNNRMQPTLADCVA